MKAQILSYPYLVNFDILPEKEKENIRCLSSPMYRIIHRTNKHITMIMNGKYLERILHD